MENWHNLAPLAALMLATGLAGGFLAGLLGVGGGIVIVPVLEFALAARGVDPAISMHVAIATSLAIIILTSIASVRAHARKNAVDFALAKSWAAPVFMGAILGSLIAAHLKSATLSAIFGTVAMIVALKMLLPFDHITIGRTLPTGWRKPVMPTLIGTVSSMMGIGGGSLTVSLLSLFEYPIHRAVGTASLVGLLIAVPGTAGFIIAGFDDPRLPMGSLGYVNLIGLLLIAPATFLTAPLGAKLAHHLTKRQLGLFFGIFLLIISGRMIYRAVFG